MKKLGVIVGRFQVPDLHEGHWSLFEAVRKKSDAMLVVLGVPATLPTSRDPLPYEMREEMVRDVIKGMNLEFRIVPLRDVGNAKLWSQNLDAIIGKNFSDMEITLYGSRDSFLEQYNGMYNVERVAIVKSPSGSEIRERIVRGKPLDFLYPYDSSARKYREGYIRAVSARQDLSYQTVDIAVLKEGRILLAQKERDNNRLRFIGGFVDPSDKSLEYAIARELNEETGLYIKPEELQYIGSFRVDDWRYRNLSDKICTALFTAEYRGDDMPVPGDDIIACKFYTPAEISLDNIVPSHRQMFEALYKHLG